MKTPKPPRKKRPTGHVAKLTIHGLDKADEKQKGRIYGWLRRLQEDLFTENYGPRFTSRLMK